MKNNVLIVGAGPTGLVLALWLSKQGIAVRIIDKNTEPSQSSRALGIHARTLELYQQMDAITAQQVPVIILFYDKVARFTQKNVHNLQPNAMNGLNLKYVQKH